MTTAIRLPGDATTAEQSWHFVELQGTVEVVGDADEQLQEMLKIGTLSFDAKEPSKCELVVGSHTLEGRVVPLKKPLLVLQKHRDEVTGQTSLITRHILRRKLQFKTRPILNV